MKLTILGLLLGVLFLEGCTSEVSAKRRANAAFLEGQAAGASQAGRSERSAAFVTVLGKVQRSTVQWEEGLTLARAIVTARYVGVRNPKSIMLRRGDETVTIPTGLLLQGGEDPLLMPGDVIERLR